MMTPTNDCPELEATGVEARCGDVVLTVADLSVVYDGERPTRAVRNVSFSLHRGEVLGIAGESGCGKSTLASALIRMLRPPARLTEGSVLFHPRGGGCPIDIYRLDGEALRQFRWAKVAMVFQSAMNALNPVTSLRKQFRDIFVAHEPHTSTDERDERARRLLEMVGIDARRIDGFAHELSGGMRQRVVIAMALALSPEIVIMDEPTTALDVVVQREILDEIERLQRELGFSVIFITHDLSLLLEISDRLAVMYAGEVVEEAPSDFVGHRPGHPYTHGLLHSFPELRGERRELTGIPGSPPDLREQLRGCAFTARCPFSFAPCSEEHPLLAPPVHTAGAESAESWQVACHLHSERLCPGGPPPGLLANAPVEEP